MLVSIAFYWISVKILERSLPAESDSAAFMHIHILGICGTFMAGLALIARELGHRVTGCDDERVPADETSVLDRAGITPIPGYDPAQLSPAPDIVDRSATR